VVIVQGPTSPPWPTIRATEDLVRLGIGHAPTGRRILHQAVALGPPQSNKQERWDTETNRNRQRAVR
jgi:hypothetical protein